MNYIVKEIRDEFIKEAKNSPTLISDLANMERYISESYDGRSLIELLQNADDANSDKFYIEKIDNNVFLVANNGRIFNKEDLRSLCRSGASTKKRKSETIGFRGIGFKSVVNFSNNVHLISGDIKITFSRELTRDVLGQNINVPLIRIPHEYIEKKYDNIIDRLLKEEYTTIFIFETNKSTLKAEINNFDNTCMLFLKNVNQIKFNYDEKRVNTISRKSLNENNLLVNINSENSINKWLVILGTNKVDSLAFKYENEEVISTKEENFIHSFMPTKDKFLIPCKVNGDFSTDPSRTRVIIDEETKNTIFNISNLISNIIIDCISNNCDNYKLIKTFSLIEKNPLSNIIGKNANDYFLDNIKECFLSSLYEYTKTKNIYIQPIWLSDDDLNTIDVSNKYIIKRKLIENLDGLEKLLNIFNIKEIDINELIDISQTNELSHYTRLNILKNIIYKYEFNMPNDIKNILNNALLFKGKENIIKLKNIKEYSDIDEDFIGDLNLILGDNKKTEFFLMKFDIKNNVSTNNNTNLVNKMPIQQHQVFSKKNIIKKWRSVEENVKLLLEESDDIDYVIDVSKRNIGYDLEAICSDGSKRFYEVKSVNDLGDTFVMTNNELLTATQHPRQYYLCVVKQSDDKIEMCLISNPANTLNLEKRARVWEYVCESYEGTRIDRNLDN